MDWIIANKTMLLTVGAALLGLAGAIVKLTPSKEDDTLFNRIVRAFGLGRFQVKED